MAYTEGEERAKVMGANGAKEASVVRCGPAGWSYSHWDGVVYPQPKPRGFHRLEYLAKYFDAVEIDMSRSGPVRTEAARLWLSKVEGNPRFRFTANLHRRFTHERLLDDSEVEEFGRCLRVLQWEGRLGCLLMQFPWAFRFTEENRDYLIRLRRAFHQFPLVAEMRHRSWLHEEALGTLIDYQIGFSNIDQPDHFGATPATALLTSGVGYIRLHGRGNGEWFRQFEPTKRLPQRDYLYTAGELVEWKKRTEQIRRFADTVFVITTNDGGGRSVVNSLELQALFGLGGGKVPSRLSSLYRTQLRRFRTDGPVQDLLFSDVRAVA